MGSFASKDVLCPYYHESETHKILCEGVDTDGKSSIHLCFGNRSDKAEYMENFCNSYCYRGCYLAQMHDTIWEDNNEQISQQ